MNDAFYSARNHMIEQYNRGSWQGLSTQEDIVRRRLRYELRIMLLQFCSGEASRKDYAHHR